ncbi:MAG: TetR/AcrR family transcriptional regulator [Lachnospiraceae bacterium]
MAFSKGKRIEDETSKRIEDLAVNIGCHEGVDALTVTRLCKELNCDRRVIYNRFRDIDEINLLVAQRCNEEILAKAKTVITPQVSFYENMTALVEAMFTYIYEKNAYFQHYTILYTVTDKGLKNEIVHYLTYLIEQGKLSGDVRAEINSSGVAQNIWILMTGIGSMLAANVNYKYQQGLNTLLYGVEALVSYMK